MTKTGKQIAGGLRGMNTAWLFGLLLMLGALTGCAGDSGSLVRREQAVYRPAPCQNIPITGLDFDKCYVSDVYGSPEFSYTLLTR